MNRNFHRNESVILVPSHMCHIISFQAGQNKKLCSDTRRRDSFGNSSRNWKLNDASIKRFSCRQQIDSETLFLSDSRKFSRLIAFMNLSSPIWRCSWELLHKQVKLNRNEKHIIWMNALATYSLCRFEIKSWWKCRVWVLGGRRRWSWWWKYEKKG